MLGLDVESAVKMLKTEGYNVELVELSSRKGVDGNEVRVIRQRLTDHGAVPLVAELTCTTVKTDCSDN